MVSQAKTDFSVGDLVEARKGERVIRDRIYAGPYEFRYLGEPSVFGPSSVGWFRDQGFTLSLVEAATPLPTEPGIYADIEGDPWKLNATTDDYEARWSFGNEYKTRAQVSQHVPFTRLEPVPDTARKVIDATIRTFNSKGGNIVDALISVSQEFGVYDARG